MEMKSHPKKVFGEHIRELDMGVEYLLNLLDPPKKDEYLSVLRYVIFYHDIFKLTEDFQKGLNEGKKSGVNHAQAAGIFLYLNDFLLPSKWKGIITNIIYFHHSFPDVDISKKFWSSSSDFDRTIENLSNYLIEIRNNIENVNFDEKFCNFRNEFIRAIDNGKIKLRTNMLETFGMSVKYSLEEYLDFLYLFAIFTIVDRISASYVGPKENFLNYMESVIKSIYDIKQLSDDVLEDYINELSRENTWLNNLRRDARKEALSNLANHRNNNIYFIELPTGMGKTLTSLSVALKIRQFPIIYSLPFLSIIEQTYSKFSKLYGENVSSLHHISPLATYPDSDPDEFLSKNLLPYKIKSITITTHERLRRTLFPSNKSDILLFPFLVHSTWIIDEIQLWPLDEIGPLERIISQISKQFGTKFIIMSATIPSLQLDDKVELIKNKEKYYSALDRYTIKKHMDIECSEEYYEKLFDETLKMITKNNRVGILVNTVRKSFEIYSFFKERFSKFGIDKIATDEPDEMISKIVNNSLVFDEIKEILSKNDTIYPGFLVYCVKELETHVIFINGRLPSLYKRRVLKWIEKLKDNNRIIVISTQSLEAGVDIDLDIIFREEDTIDSLVQTAGRVNRNGFKKYGTLYLLKSDSSSRFLKNVRGIGYKWVEPFLEEISNKSEKDLYAVIKRWYHRLREKVIPTDKKEIMKCIGKFSFSEMRKELYSKRTKEYLFCEGKELASLLDHKKEEYPNNYEEKIKFFKKLGINHRITLLLKGEHYEGEEDLMESIEELICPNSNII